MSPADRPTLRRSGLAIIIDGSGRYLLTQRTPWIPYPLAWCFPGGRGHPHEPHRDIVAREAREELGLDVLPREELFRFVHLPWDESWWLSSLGPGRIRGNWLEVLRWRWLTRDEVFRLPYFLQHQFFTRCLERNAQLP